MTLKVLLAISSIGKRAIIVELTQCTNATAVVEKGHNMCANSVATLTIAHSATRPFVYLKMPAVILQLLVLS